MKQVKVIACSKDEDEVFQEYIVEVSAFDAFEVAKAILKHAHELIEDHPSYVHFVEQFMLKFSEKTDDKILFAGNHIDYRATLVNI